MITITDIQSTARPVVTLALLVLLGAWYLARCDRLKHALCERRAAMRRRPPAERVKVGEL